MTNLKQTRVRDAIEKLRKRLLDLSGRNRLLNYRFYKASTLQVVNQNPDELFERLLDERTFRFQGVPEPTHEELLKRNYLEWDPDVEEFLEKQSYPTPHKWAIEIGIVQNTDLSFEISNSKSRFNRVIQTVHYPHSLEALLKKIKTKADTAIQETGSNYLFLVIGFLSYFDAPHSDKENLAPLILVPVKLEKGKIDKETNSYFYSVSYTGEDLLPNLSLIEKMRIEHGIAFPELNGDTRPSEYFAKIQNILAKNNKHRWRIKNQANLALLNLTQLLKYLDLDTERWPNLLEHPIILELFNQNEKEFGGDFSFEEYEIDEIPSIYKDYPTILDADTSQHHAIIDVLDGNNLVIEGPPGTGKSQTIVNLIAAAISRNLKVLFVAEKMAALEVVKRKLSNLGLGDLCLELHSHKTQKSKFIDGIKKRFNMEPMEYPEKLDDLINRLEVHRDRLKEYVEVINSEWEASGLTIHEILHAATRYRKEIYIDAAKCHPHKNIRDFFSINKVKDIEEIADAYSDALKAVSSFTDEDTPKKHPWYGLQNTALEFHDRDEICNQLAIVQNCLHQLVKKINDLKNEYKISIDPNSLSLSSFESICKQIDSIPDITDDAFIHLLPQLSEGHLVYALQRDIREFEDLYLRYIELSYSFSEKIILSPDALLSLNRQKRNLPTILQANDKLSELDQLKQEVTEITDSLKYYQEFYFSKIINESKDLGKYVKANKSGVKAFIQVLNVVSLLPPSHIPHRDSLFDNFQLDKHIPELSSSIMRLREIQKELEVYFDISKVPDITELKNIENSLQELHIFKWFDKKWRFARRELFSISNSSKHSLKQLVSQLSNLILFVEKRNRLESDHLYNKVFGPYFQGIATDINKIHQLRKWYKAVREKFGVGFGPDVELGNLIINLPDLLFNALQVEYSQGIVTSLQLLVESIEELEKSISFEWNNESLIEKDGQLTLINNYIDDAVEVLSNVEYDQNTSLAEFTTQVKYIESIQKNYKKWRKENILNQLCPNTQTLTLENPENSNLLDSIKQVSNLAKVIHEDISDSYLNSALYNNPDKEYYEELKIYSQEANKIIEKYYNSYKKLVKTTEINYSLWYPSSEAGIVRWIARNDYALNNKQSISSWLDYIKAKYEVVDNGLKELTIEAEVNNLKPQQFKHACLLGLYDAAAREILSNHPILRAYSGLKLESARKKYIEYDRDYIRLQAMSVMASADEYTFPEGIDYGLVGEYTEYGLLKNEISKRKRHIPIRQLISRAGETLSSIKPCFMMSPMSVAQYLPQDYVEFDLVIMDEASQMKPEDAIGSIARGKQFVVVGDPKQLPPTTFFDKLSEDDYPDEYSIAMESVESILDAATPIFNKRSLMWHYRSEHEKLIEFSNRHFYDNKLILFPSPNGTSNQYGIRFHYINNGTFIDRRNIEEARQIASLVKKLVLTGQSKSIGVVAMNSIQRELIEDEIEVLAKQDDMFREMFEKVSKKDVEPFFVKNLENVQGDERDIIIISITYGPETIGGPVMQRFGPINTDVGWRRLNVLFTRSKKRMYIFSSMKSEQIKITSHSKRGVYALKEFLHFAESGHKYAPIKTGKSPDSDFEIAVMKFLNEAGFKCIPQLGVAGYYLDIAVINPNNDNEYLLGIECDGATYHSSKSVRDRDRLRQEVLENLGWKIMRIWSTDWYKDPESAIKPIIKEIKRRVSLIDSKSYAEPDYSLSSDDSEVYEIDLNNSLHTVLNHFNRDVILKAVPDIPKDHRLLRTKMIELFVKHKPITVNDFQKYIPAFMRNSLDPREGKYLHDVLEIISRYK